MSLTHARRPLLALVCVVATASGCRHDFARVQLPPPPTGATSAEARTGYYDAHGAAGIRHQTTSLDSRWFGPTPMLVLHDGSVVEHAGDLVDAVDADSDTARFAAVAEDASASASAWRIGATATVVAGLAVVLGGLLVPIAAPPGSTDIASEPSAIASLALLGGGGLIAVSSLIQASISVNQTRAGLEAHDAAFQSYDTSLRARLELPAAPVVR